MSDPWHCNWSVDSAFLPTPRVTYYNASLSEAGLAKMTSRMRKAVLDGEYDDGSSAAGGRLVKPNASHPYNLVSSLCCDGFHRPALDIDWPDFETAEDVAAVLADEDEWRHKKVRIIVVPSTSNWHAYIPDVAYPHDEYMDLLQRLADAGVIEDAYRLTSVRRGQTLLRPPHVKKPAQ